MILPESPVSYVATRVQMLGFRYLPIEDADIQGISDLPMVYRDPFDWLLLATAQRLSLPMISRDSLFKK
jgi:PIN domain nuclease of toxin-antitoxin system